MPTNLSFDYLFSNFESLHLNCIPHWNTESATLQNKVIEFFRSSIESGFNKKEANLLFFDTMSFRNHCLFDNYDYMMWKVTKNAKIQYLNSINKRILDAKKTSLQEFEDCQVIALHNASLKLTGYCNAKCGEKSNVEMKGNKNRLFCGNKSFVKECANGSQITVGDDSVIFSERNYEQQDTLYRQLCDTVFVNDDLGNENYYFDENRKISSTVYARPDFWTHYKLVVSLGHNSSCVILSHGKYLTFKSGSDLKVNVKYKFDMTIDRFVEF